METLFSFTLGVINLSMSHYRFQQKVLLHMNNDPFVGVLFINCKYVELLTYSAYTHNAAFLEMLKNRKKSVLTFG